MSGEARAVYIKKSEGVVMNARDGLGKEPLLQLGNVSVLWGWVSEAVT